jgi:hypothetical protein
MTAKQDFSASSDWSVVYPTSMQGAQKFTIGQTVAAPQNILDGLYALGLVQ